MLLSLFEHTHAEQLFSRSSYVLIIANHTHAHTLTGSSSSLLCVRLSVNVCVCGFGSQSRWSDGVMVMAILRNGRCMTFEDKCEREKEKERVRKVRILTIRTTFECDNTVVHICRRQ